MTKNVPKLRFKEFINAPAWEQRKLGEIADIIGGGTPSTDILEYWDGDIDWYSPVEIDSKIYVNNSRRKITELGYKNSSAKLLPPGTVLFTSRAGIGKTAILQRKGCTNQGFQSIVPKANELDTYFIFSRTNELKKYGELVGAGSTFVEVSGKQMKEMNILIPHDFKEQKKIGELFTKLDNLITFHQRKVEKAENIKKAFLEEMFPTEGQRKPKRRFKGFTEDWEQRKLKDTCKYIASSITVDNIIQNGRYELYDANNIIGKTNKLPIFENYISIIKDGAGVGRVRRLPKNSNILGTMGALIPKKCDYNFLFYYLETINFQEFISGGTIPHIYFSQYGEKLIYFPCIDEQKKIGEFLSDLDKPITYHKNKVNKYKEIKEALLNDMFV